MNVKVFGSLRVAMYCSKMSNVKGEKSHICIQTNGQTDKIAQVTKIMLRK